MRKTIFEQIKERISFASEINRLDTLINDSNGICVKIPNRMFKNTDNPFDTKHYSLENFFDTFMFKTWKARGTCISCEDMRETLNLDEIVDSDNPSFEDTISYCEYVANIFNMFSNQFKDGDGLSDDGVHYYGMLVWFREIYDVIKDNLESMMDWLNQEMVFFENEERVLITEKNAAVTAVAECVDEELAYQIVKYNHYTLKCDISKKKEILLKLDNELEPKRKQLSSLNGQLETNIFFMLNNLDLRHNNSSENDRNYKDYVAKMKNNKLEEWYDELYQMMLLAMLELEQGERNQKINELKSHF